MEMEIKNEIENENGNGNQKMDFDESIKGFGKYLKNLDNDDFIENKEKIQEFYDILDSLKKVFNDECEVSFNLGEKKYQKGEIKLKINGVAIDKDKMEVFADNVLKKADFLNIYPTLDEKMVISVGLNDVFIPKTK